MSASAQNDRVNNLTLEDINASVVDTVNNSSEVMKRIVSKPKSWNGRQKQVPLFTNNSSLGTSFKGVETFDTSIDMNTVNFTFYPTGYAQPVGVSVIERSINSTPAGVIDLYKTSWEYAQNSMITALANIFYGYGTGNDFDGFGVIVDDGTNTSTYGGLSRTTYGNQINAGGATGLVAATAGVLDLATMNSADNAATISGNLSETPNVIMSNPTVWGLYESLLLPTTRANYAGLGGAFISGGTAVNQQVSQSDALALKGGALSLEYRGKPIVRDQKTPSGLMYFFNERWFEFDSLSLEGLDTVATSESVTVGAYEDYKVSAFQFRKFMQPVNQLAEVGIFVMYGQLFCKNPNRNEAITGITTV